MSNDTYDAFIPIVVICMLICVCGAILRYYRGADDQLEFELDRITELNTVIASETEQLRRDVEVHRDGIASVTVEVAESRERIRHVYTDIEETGSATERAIFLIDECQDILEEIKAQR